MKWSTPHDPNAIWKPPIKMVMAWKDGLWHWVCHVSVNTVYSTSTYARSSLWVLQDVGWFTASSDGVFWACHWLYLKLMAFLGRSFHMRIGKEPWLAGQQVPMWGISYIHACVHAYLHTYLPIYIYIYTHTHIYTEVDRWINKEIEPTGQKNGPRNGVSRIFGLHLFPSCLDCMSGDVSWRYWAAITGWFAEIVQII